MKRVPSLSLALQWLAAEQGLTPYELAVSSGLTPATVKSFLGKPHPAVSTWLAMLSALQCRLEIATASRSLNVSLPTISPHRRDHALRQWQYQRLVAFRAQLLRQDVMTTRAEAHETANNYVIASTERMFTDLKKLTARLKATRLDTDVEGCREAVRSIAHAVQATGEDLALLSGKSVTAARIILEQGHEGRLMVPHRLFSAIAARIVIHPAGGGTVGIALASPGTWRPEPPRTSRCSLTPLAVRTRFQRGESMVALAREAGVSRQRIHAIVRG